jgi:hypothetical protein
MIVMNFNIIETDKKLSYTAAREALINRAKLVSPGCNIGLHSFRSGGATVAAKHILKTLNMDTQQ